MRHLISKITSFSLQLCRQIKVTGTHRLRDTVQRKTAGYISNWPPLELNFARELLNMKKRKSRAFYSKKDPLLNKHFLERQ